jgi:replicative DNA helicase
MSREQKLIPEKSFYQEEAQIYDTGSERAFLSCIMREPSLMDEARSKVLPKHIYNDYNRQIYTVMLWMHKKQARDKVSATYDVMSLMSEATAAGEEKEQNFLRMTGGLDHLQAIERSPVRIQAFGNYVQNILSRSIRVEAYRRARDIQMFALAADTESTSEFVSDIEGKILSVSASRGDNDIIRLGDGVERFLRHCENNRGENKIGVNVTFLPRLMEVMNTIRRKQFVVLFARPKTGKSAFFLNLGLDVAVKQNIPVLFIDTEMSEDEQLSRAVASWSKVEEWDIVKGHFVDSAASKQAVGEFSQLLKDSPFFYSAARGITTEQLISRCRQFKSQYVGEETDADGVTRTKPCLIIYDWLKVNSGVDAYAEMREYQVLGEICTAIKDVCNELDVPVIAGAQSNREGAGAAIDKMSAYSADKFLADSDRILRFCNCLIWLRRLSPDEQVDVEAYDAEYFYNQMLHVVDQRGGPTCMNGIPLHYSPKILSYTEKDHIPENAKKVEKEEGEDEQTGAEPAPAFSSSDERLW